MKSWIQNTFRRLLFQSKPECRRLQFQLGDEKNAYPTAEKIPKIAECLGVSISELYGLTDEGRIETQPNNPFGSELVWKTYMTLTEKEKLEVQVYILGKGEAHEE